MSEQQPAGGMKAFSLVWVGQLVSLLGSGLTSFALGIWALEKSHSVTQYTTIIVCASLPGVLFAPFGGALVDRWNRKLVMLMSDLGPALVTLVYAYLLWKGELQVWHIYIGVAFNSILGTLQWPAYISAISMLVEPKQYARVNGMLEFGGAATTIAAPALSGLLLTIVDIWGVLLIDFATFLFAAVTLLLVRIPNPEVSDEGQRSKGGSFWKEAAFGWTFIRERPGLFRLLLFFAVVNFAVCVCGVATLPMVLGFTGSRAAVGTIMSLVGIGMLIGGGIMTATGGPKNKKVYVVLGAALVFTVCFVLVGIRPSLFLVGAGVLIWYIVLPIQNSCSTAIWQAKTPPDVQGRVFSMRRMIAQFTTPLGDFSAGPLADHVFNPLLMPGGALAHSVGKVIGVGPGRGIGLMYLIMALVPGLAAIWGFMNPRVRNVETELPDAPRRRAAPAPPPEEAPEAAPAETPAQA